MSELGADRPARLGPAPVTKAARLRDAEINTERMGVRQVALPNESSDPFAADCVPFGSAPWRTSNVTWDQRVRQCSAWFFDPV